jgi:hypothetical protein
MVNKDKKALISVQPKFSMNRGVDSMGNFRGIKTYTLGTYKLGPRAGGTLLIFTGLLFVIIGISIEWNTLMFLPGSVSTTGIIVACEIVDPTDGNDCQPTFQFQTQAGRSITIKSINGSTTYFEGQAVRVEYHPGNPQDARIDPGMFWLIFVALGSLFILLGLGMYVRGFLSSKKGVG